MTRQPSVVIIGAGPAGLTAAYESTRRGFHPIVLEKSDGVGGLSRTEVYRGRFFHYPLDFFNTLFNLGLIESLLAALSCAVLCYLRSRFWPYPEEKTLGLIIDRKDVLRGNWLYVHSSEVKVGRIQNYKNWSTAMVPDLSKTSLGLEYFCAEGDTLWCMSDADLVALATQEIVKLGLADAAEVEDSVVIILWEI